MPTRLPRLLTSSHRRPRVALALLLPGLAFGPGQARADDWPGYRGPTGMGTTTEKNLPLTWGGPENQNVLWKSPLPPTIHEGEPDHNQSSPAVADGKVVVTSAHWAAGTDRGKVQPDHHVACYDAASGKLLWDTKVPAGPLTLTDLRGGYAVPTPAIADGRVFAFFGSAIVHALDLSGKLLWSHVVADHEKFDVAIATSPIVHHDTVLLTLDRKKPDSTIIALTAADGKLRWKVARPENDFSHVTPVLATIAGRTQLLASTTSTLEGIDPANGEVLWSCRWGQSLWPVSSPVMANGLVYAIGGRGGHGGVVVDPTGRGDVTDTHLKWKVRPMSEGLSSPVAFEDRVYRLNSPAGLRCVRITDGEELFKESLSNADPSISPFVTPDGKIYFASAGKTVVIAADSTLKILAECDLGDPSRAAAAVADGRIFLKGTKFLHAVGNAKQP